MYSSSTRLKGSAKREGANLIEYGYSKSGHPEDYARPRSGYMSILSDITVKGSDNEYRTGAGVVNPEFYGNLLLFEETFYTSSIDYDSIIFHGGEPKMYYYDFWKYSYFELPTEY